MFKPRYETRLSAFPLIASVVFFLGWLFLLFRTPEWANDPTKINSFLGIAIVTALWAIHLATIEGQP